MMGDFRCVRCGEIEWHEISCRQTVCNKCTMKEVRAKKEKKKMVFETGKFYSDIAGNKAECVCVTEAEVCLKYCSDGSLLVVQLQDREEWKEWKESKRKVQHAPAIYKLKDGRGLHITTLLFSSEEIAKKQCGETFYRWPAYEANWPILEVEE